MFCRVLVLCAGILTVLPATADVYRSVDENGQVVFSDKPSPGAEKVDIPPPQTMPADQVKNPEVKPSTQTQPQQHPQPGPGYKTLAVTYPKDQQAVRANDGNVSINVNVSPPLNPADALVFVVDGNKHPRTKSTTLNLFNLNRGQHEVYVEIADTNGTVEQTSSSVTFYVLRHSILHPHPTAPP